MTNKPALYILFTMDCEPAMGRGLKEGPANWELAARSSEGFCARLSWAGYAATLFVSPPCAEETAPLLEDLATADVELGLYLHPRHLGDNRFKKPLGKYAAEEQQALVEAGIERFRDALGVRPQSFRSALFSASDATYGVLFGLGFRQGSISSPGRDVPRDAARWTGAEPGVHYVDADDRLKAGNLPFLEVPVTTDPTRVGRAGWADDLWLESGEFEKWHRPIVQRQLERMAAENVEFRSLCIFTRNRVPYHEDAIAPSKTLEAFIDFCDELRETYEVIPTTVAGAHERWVSVTRE
jgi:hypothetical protein